MVLAVWADGAGGVSCATAGLDGGITLEAGFSGSAGEPAGLETGVMLAGLPGAGACAATFGALEKRAATTGSLEARAAMTGVVCPWEGSVAAELLPPKSTNRTTKSSNRADPAHTYIPMRPGTDCRGWGSAE